MVPDLNENMQQVVKRAIRGLRAHETVVRTKQDALNVHGIGQWVATKLETFILNNPVHFPPANQIVESFLQYQSQQQQQQQQQQQEAEKQRGREELERSQQNLDPQERQQKQQSRPEQTRKRKCQPERVTRTASTSSKT